MDNCEACMRRIEDHESRLKGLEEHRSSSDVVFAQIEIKLDNLISMFNKLDEKVTELYSKPSKRWDLIVTVVITAMATGFVGMMMSAIQQ